MFCGKKGKLCVEGRGRNLLSSAGKRSPCRPFRGEVLSASGDEGLMAVFGLKLR